MSPELERLPALPIEEELIVESSEIDWKSILQSTLAPSQAATETQRLWGKLSSHIRSLCPESDWIFIREESQNVQETAFLPHIQRWLESLIANPAWPFPEKIYLTAESSGAERIWKLYIDEADGALPYVAISSKMTITPFKETRLRGWKISSSPAYHINKSGEA